MTTTPTTIPDVFLIQPDVFSDERGSFFESYNRDKFAQAGITDTFIQDNVSTSKQGVLRGLHFQAAPYSQGKLVSVAVGEVFDVAVDIRMGSPTYGKWFGVKLSAENHTMLFVPAGLAHGFYVLSETAQFTYKISGNLYNKESSTGIIWNDPTIRVDWPLLPGTTPILSAQDAALPPLN